MDIHVRCTYVFLLKVGQTNSCRGESFHFFLRLPLSFVEVLRVILLANLIKNKGENEIIFIGDFDRYSLIQN